MSDAISFKSKIKFISNLEYLKNFNKGDYIGFRHNEPNVLKSDRFYTQCIRTCTAGGLVTTRKKSLGFHIWDDKFNDNNFEKIINSIFKPFETIERGLLIGSKNLKSSPYSLVQFKRFKDFFFERVPNLTLFEMHKQECSQSHITYSLEDDTWLIASDFLDDETEKHYQVDSLMTLKKAFKNIKIAQGDELYIGGKRILPEEAPGLFY